MHAKHNSLSEATRSLSQGPRQTISCRPRRPTQNPTLCLVDIPGEMQPHGYLIPSPSQKSTPPPLAVAGRARGGWVSAYAARRRSDVGDLDSELFVSRSRAPIAAQQSVSVVIGGSCHQRVIDGASRDREMREAPDELTLLGLPERQALADEIVT